MTSSTEFTGVDTTSSTPTGVIDNGIQNLKTLATEPLRQIVTENIQNLPQSIAPTTGSRSYYSASQSGQDFPLGVNAERLQSQIPVTVRDGLQSLLPRTRSLPVDNDLPQVAPF
ncbi:MAG: hypothetical protein R3C01_17740 [Planctomycetaceae bacterium]